MINAARIGQTFGQDPVALLREQGDPLLSEIRLAALRVVHRDEEAQTRQAAKSR